MPPTWNWRCGAGLPLATLDDKLKSAAAAVGVPLYGVNQHGVTKRGSI